LETTHFSSDVALPNLSVTRLQNDQETTNGIEPGEGRTHAFDLQTHGCGLLTMSPALRIGIVGAGLAGLATALTASSAGAAVEVFDAPAAATSKATHLHVTANLLRDLNTLGLADRCVRQGFPYKGMVVADVHGRAYAELPSPRLAGEALPPALGMVYGDLLGLLREAAVHRGARLHPGTTIVDALPDATLVTHAGAHHPMDLAVLTNGNENSTPRSAFAAWEPQALPQLWCQTLVPRPVALDRATLVVSHEHHKVLLVPVDTRRAGAAVMWNEHELPSTAAVRHALAAQGGIVAPVARHWGAATPVTVQPVRFGMQPGPWHAQRVLRIGPAALVLPPHFGQQAAQAVEDALVLGELLRASLPHDELLPAFEARRVDRARRVLEITTQAARWNVRPDASTDLLALAERLVPLVAHPA
jgi:2-polyprenyl-6-methoxyphenol hydroxylase-like FAD-dependent oxidoreductase